MSPRPPLRDHPSRSSLFGLAALIAAAIAYGSLLPFEFQGRPLAAAWQSFLAAPWHRLGVASRADWIANLLLYIPLGFVLTGALGGASRRPWGAGMLAVAAAAALAVAIEFAQVFFPHRMVSWNDLAAEMVGGIVGAALWPVAGPALARLAADLGRGGPQTTRAALVLYLVAYLALSLFPFDFVLGADEFAWRLAQGRDAWVIAPALCGGMVSCTVKLAVEVAAALPLGLLAGLGTRSRPGLASAFAAGCLLGGAIELAQLFVASASSQGLSVILRGAGVALGVGLARHLDLDAIAGMRRLARPLVLTGIVPYVLLLLTLNGWWRGGWLPLDEGLAKLHEVRFLPFHYHYFTTELNALRSAMQHALAYAPVGVGFWLWAAGGGGRTRTGAAAIVAFLLAAAIEGAKLLLPGRHPDPTDALIAAAAAAAAAWLLGRLAVRAGPQDPFAPAGAAREGQPADAQAGPEESRRVASGRGAAGHGSPAASVPVEFAYPRSRRLLWLAVPLLLFAGWALWGRPYAAWVAPALLAWAFLVWRTPALGVPGVLAFLPVLDLAPLTGRFFLDEFDLMVVVTAATLAAAGRWLPPRGSVGGLPLLLVAFAAASVLASAAVGLWPLDPLDANAFASYYSHYNSLRALKGFAWAVLLLPPLMALMACGDRGRLALARGIVAGLALCVATVLWERLVFPGLFNFSNDFRATGLFSGLHTGGAFLEGYLVAAAPFLVAWARLERRWWAGPLAAALFVGTTYAVLVTFARAGYAGLAVAAFVAVASMAPAVRRAGHRGLALALLVPLAIGAAVAVALPILGGSFMQSRWATLKEDARIRTRHWVDALSMMEPGLPAQVLGQGLGGFPLAYLSRGRGANPPATYGFAGAGDATFLRLGSGDSLYFGQRVAVDARTDYTIALTVRASAPKGRLTIPVCEKSILYSFRCQWLEVHIQGKPGEWQRQELRFNSQRVGEGRWPLRRPVELALYNPQAGTVVDVDEIGLRGPDGENLLRNGSFSDGMDHWFFSTDNHLPWHPKNLGVQVYFEQGWLGVVTAGLLLLAGLARLGRLALRGDPWCSGALASLAGFLVVGLFDSLFDAPRVATLYYLILLSAFGPDGGEPRSGSPSRVAGSMDASGLRAFRPQPDGRAQAGTGQVEQHIRR